VRWNLANTDELREATSWPPSGILPLRLHATDDMRLTEAAVAGEAIVRWTHDPDDLVRSSASNAFAFLLEKPDEAPLGERADVLAFTAAPVECAVDLVGPVVARARIWSSGPKMDFFVRLIDLAPTAPDCGSRGVRCT
jgi:predicted acyl esterase